MGDAKVTINRTLVGVIALACLLTAGGLWIGARGDTDWDMWRGAFTRIGILMSAFWVALPSKGREAAWKNLKASTFIGLLLAIVALVRLPFRVVIPVAIALAIVGSILRPRQKKRPAGS